MNYGISLVICKCNVKCDKGIIVHEEQDKDKFIPDGRRIVYVKSNFVCLYHESFKHEVVRVKSTNKGRKPNPKKVKRKKCNGSGEQFDSSIAFGVLYEDSVYNIIVFRKESVNISGLNDDNIEKTKNIIGVLMDYMNEIDPSLNVRIVGDPIINLCNLKSEILPTIEPQIVEADTKVCYNFHRLTKLINEKYSGRDFWRCDNYIVMYNNSNSYFTMHFLVDNQKYGVKLFYNGKINVFGGKNKDYCVLLLQHFYDILTSNPHLAQYSVPVRLKNQVVYH
jgi:hypothetical protein